MNKKLLYSLLGLFIGLLISLSANANYLSDWSNDELCGWMESTSIPRHIQDEVDKREILCNGGIEVLTLPVSDSYEGKNGTIFASPDPSLIPQTKSDYSY